MFYIIRIFAVSYGDVLAC